MASDKNTLNERQNNNKNLSCLIKANIKNILVSPYPTLIFLRYGSAGRKNIFFSVLPRFGIQFNFIVNGPLKVIKSNT